MYVSALMYSVCSLRMPFICTSYILVRIFYTYQQFFSPKTITLNFILGIIMFCYKIQSKIFQNALLLCLANYFLIISALYV
uniref:Uncharacterized protein n=1 Tax=Ciona intestinalis TaxID=7719 RepID=H2XTA8_CIOIN